MKYRVVTYMRIEPDDDVLYDTREDAEADVDQCQLMQSQDIHVIEEVTEPSPSSEEFARRIAAARATQGIWKDVPPKEKTGG